MIVDITDVARYILLRYETFGQDEKVESALQMMNDEIVETITRLSNVISNRPPLTVENCHVYAKVVKRLQEVIYNVTRTS